MFTLPTGSWWFWRMAGVNIIRTRRNEKMRQLLANKSEGRRLKAKQTQRVICKA